MNHDVVVVRPLCESLCLSAASFSSTGSPPPSANTRKGSARTKPNSLSGMWVNALAKPDARLLCGVCLAEHKQLTSYAR